MRHRRLILDRHPARIPRAVHARVPAGPRPFVRLPSWRVVYGMHSIPHTTYPIRLCASSCRASCVFRPAGTAHCPRWKARGPDCRPSVRHAVAWPLVSHAFREPTARCSGWLAPPSRTLTALRGGEHPLKALRQLRFSRPRLQKQAVSGLRSVSFAGLTPGIGAARLTPFRGCSPPTSSAPRVGAFGPPHSDRRAWARLFPRVGALSKPAKSAPVLIGALARKFRRAAPPGGAGRACGSTYPRRGSGLHFALRSLRDRAFVPASAPASRPS